MRAALAALVGVEPEHVSLTGSTTDGCNIVLAGLDLGPEDEIVIDREEHFGLTRAGACERCPRRRRRRRAGRDPRGRDAADTPAGAFAGALDERSRCSPVHELRERTGVPMLVDGAQSVGAIPVDASGLDFLTISGQKWLCGPDATGALVVADPERLRVARPSYFSQSAYEPTGSFEPAAGAARFDPGWIRPPASPAWSTALALPPDWRFERAAEQTAPLPRAAGAARRGRARETRRSSPSGTRIRRRWSPSLAEADVVVRELPGTRPRARLLRLVDERGGPRRLAAAL